MDRRFAEVEARFKDRDVERPPIGGLSPGPAAHGVLAGGDSRFHDRIAMPVGFGLGQRTPLPLTKKPKGTTMPWWQYKPGLKTGTRAGFDLLDEEGRAGAWRTTAALAGVFFLSLDNSPVCLKEACAFNEQWELFAKRRRNPGCSGQDAASHLAMRAACRLRYRLLCDVDGPCARPGECPTAWFRPEPRHLPGGSARQGAFRLQQTCCGARTTPPDLIFLAGVSQGNERRVSMPQNAVQPFKSMQSIFFHGRAAALAPGRDHPDLISFVGWVRTFAVRGAGRGLALGIAFG